MKSTPASSITSIVLAAVANFLIFSGIKMVGASSASIIEIMYPFFVVLFSFIFFRTTPSTYFIIGAILAYAPPRMPRVRWPLDTAAIVVLLAGVIVIWVIDTHPPILASLPAPVIRFVITVQVGT